MTDITPRQWADRRERLYALGCICCLRAESMGFSMTGKQTELHHLNKGGKAGQERRGHRFTIPLCLFHHQGGGFPFKWNAQKTHGPSLALSSRNFRMTYGTDDELLADVDKLIGWAA